MVASLLPNGKQQFIDALGAPLVGGLVYFYIPETSTFKDTWQDPGQTILNTNPIILDDRGQAIIYGAGQYRQVLFDADGNLIWDQLTSDYSGGGSGSGIQYGAQLTIASASTTDISTITTHNVIITGTTTIDSFGSNADTNNPTYIVQFTDALTLTYNASTFILPGADDIITAAGDSSIWMYLGSGSWQCIEYTVASGSSVTTPTLQTQTFTDSGTFTIPNNATADTQFEFLAIGGGGGGGGANSGSDPVGGSGGGSGGAIIALYKGFTASQPVAIVIGASGAAGASTGGNGGTGGNTTVSYAASVLITANGGSPGSGSSATHQAGGSIGAVSAVSGTITLVASYNAGAQPGSPVPYSNTIGPGQVGANGGGNSVGTGGKGPGDGPGSGGAGTFGGGGAGGLSSLGLGNTGGVGGKGIVIVRWVG